MRPTISTLISLTAVTLTAGLFVSARGLTRATVPDAPAAPIGTKTYTDPTYGFSFDYPENLNLGSFEAYDEHGNPWHIVLVQSDDARSGFQVANTGYDEGFNNKAKLTTRTAFEFEPIAASNSRSTMPSATFPSPKSPTDFAKET